MAGGCDFAVDLRKLTAAGRASHISSNSFTASANMLGGLPWLAVTKALISSALFYGQVVAATVCEGVPPVSGTEVSIPVPETG